MTMLLDLPEDILRLIIHRLFHDDRTSAKSAIESQWEHDLPTRNYQWRQNPHSLENLRQCCRSLREQVDAVLFSSLRIRRLDDAHTSRLEYILRSSYLPWNVRTYTLTPLIVTIRPIVKRSHWDYYGDLLPSCGNWEPSQSALLTEHEMRQTVAKHYDEQYGIIWSPEHMSWLSVLYHGYLADRITTPEPPFGANLAQSAYLRALNSFPNLRKLHIQFVAVMKATVTSKICRAINHQFAIGLAKYLVTNPENLTQLELTDVPVESLGLLCATINEQWVQQPDTNAGSQNIPTQFRLKSLQELKLGLRYEVYDDSYKLDSDFYMVYPQVFSGIKGNDSVGQFLSLMPNLVRMDLFFNNRDDKYNDEWLEIDVAPEVTLPHLQFADFHNLVMSAEALIKLTVNTCRPEATTSGRKARIECAAAQRVLIPLYEDSGPALSVGSDGSGIRATSEEEKSVRSTWADVFNAWNKETDMLIQSPAPLEGSWERTRYNSQGYLQRSTTGSKIVRMADKDFLAWQRWYEDSLKYLPPRKKY